MLSKGFCSDPMNKPIEMGCLWMRLHCWFYHKLSRDQLGGYLRRRLSKFVSHPFVLEIVTAEHVPVQPVAIVASCPTASVACLFGCPAQLRVMVLATVPPLYASS
jgi:hypothetical protein